MNFILATLLSAAALLSAANAAVTWDISEVTVHVNELTQAMKWSAIDIFVQLVPLKQANEVMAKTLADSFAKSYGGMWTAVIGPTGFMSTYMSEPNTAIMYVYKNMQVLLYKPLTTEPKMDMKALIEKAKTAAPKVIWQSETFSAADVQAIIDISKLKLSTATSINDIADKVLMDVSNKWPATTWSVYVGTENDYILDFYGKQYAAVEYRMDKLMLIVTKKLM